MQSLKKIHAWAQMKVPLYFIYIIYDKYTNNTEYDYNTTMGFRRKSNDLFESVSQEFTLLIYVLSCRICHLCRE